MTNEIHPKTPHIMTASKLTATIDEAIQLDREISAKEERLKELKKIISEEAENRPDELTEGQGGGQVWTAESSAGELCRVSFPIPSLKASLKPDDKGLSKAREISGKLFDQLFTADVIYRPVSDFRNRAVNLLEARDANKLVKAVSSATKPKVSFETKEAA